MASLVAELGDGLLRFPRWWFAELAGLVPGRLRRALRERNRWVVFDLSRGELTVSRVTGDKTREVGRVDLSLAPAARRSAVAKLARRLDLRNATLVLRLAEGEALRKRVELPLAAEENLRQVVSFEMDRQTPFKPTEVYFDCRVVERDAERQRLGVEMVVVPRAVVDGALGTLGEWGLAPEVVDLADGEGRAPGELNLLPPGEAPAQRRAGGALNFLLAGVALGLMGAVVYLALERQAAVAEAMKERVALARVDAEAVGALRQEIELLVEDGRFLRDRKRDGALMGVTLNEITRVLPDHTWVYQLRLNGGEMQVWGYSSAASEIVSLIDASPAFAEVKFRSPVTRDARLGLERFNLSATMAAPKGEAAKGDAAKGEAAKGDAK